MGEPETPDFYDFGISDPATKPQHQHYLSLETPGHLKQIKNTWEHLGKILFCVNMRFKFSKFSERLKHPLFVLLCLFLYKTEYIIIYYILWRWGLGNDKFPIQYISKSLDMNFISIKKHEMEIWEIVQTFLFSRKGSSNINLPEIKEWKGII